MFGEGADMAHKCMRWILGVTGGLANRAGRLTALERGTDNDNKRV